VIDARAAGPPGKARSKSSHSFAVEESAQMGECCTAKHASLVWGAGFLSVGDGSLRASATLGRSQDVCKGARFLVEGERCVVSS